MAVVDPNDRSRSRPDTAKATKSSAADSADRVPLPSTTLLLPNPLTAPIAPPATIDRSRSQDESMLIAVECYAFTNNLEAIVDRLGGSQHFEIARR